MSNELHAHIFGRSRSGDREAVKMKLYHPDGEEFEPGSTVTGRMWSGKGSPNLPGPLALEAVDDFSVDHLGDPAWWSFHPSGPGGSSVNGEQFHAEAGFGTLMFMKSPLAVEGRVSLPVRFTDPTAVVKLQLCAEKTMATQGIGGNLSLTGLTHEAFLQGSTVDQYTNTFATPLVLNHLYTLCVTLKADCSGDISVYDGPRSESPLAKVDFNSAVPYKSYFYSTPGRVVFSGHHFTADEILYEDPSPPIPIGANDDFYFDTDTGDIYGPKVADTWVRVSNSPGISTNMADVTGAIDMTPQWPMYDIDCAGKTVVHARNLIINSATANKYVQINLNNLKRGVPYQVTVENASNFAHYISLATGTDLTGIIVAGGQVKSSSLLLAPGEVCSIASFFTGPADRPLAVTTRMPRSPRRDVVASYVCTDFDVNGLIVANSASPLTVTIRNQNTGDWWKGEEVEIYQAGAGAVTVAAPAGTTITRTGGTTGNFVMPGGRYSTIKLRAIDYLKWIVL